MKLPTSAGVYTITNIVNGKMYVGYTNNFKTRWFAGHKDCLKHNRHNNIHLQSAWNKYGEKNFVFEVLVECSEELLNSEEHYWATILNTHSRRYGYNILPTNPCGRPSYCTEEIKIKISKALKGRTVSKDVVERRNATRKKNGPWHTKASRKKSSESNKGKKMPESAKERLRIIFKERGISTRVREKGAESRQRPVIQLSMNDEFIKEFKSISDAARELGVRIAGCKIDKVCQNKPYRKSAYGYKWKYKEDYLTEEQVL